MPARWGVAIDVPWKKAKHGGASQYDAGIDESTLTPGATTSGLIRASTSVGPWLENAAMMFARSGAVRTYANAVIVPVTGVGAAMIGCRPVCQSLRPSM